MRVIKRSGRMEDVSFDKVICRLQALCTDGNIDLDVIDIARQVISEIHDGIKTSELDNSAAEKCAYMVTVNPAYGKLAGRIAISNNQKNTSSSFSETVNMLYNNTDMHGKSVPLVSDEVYEVVQKHKHKLNDVIDYTRDFNFDFFSFMTLIRAYLIKIGFNPCERIQDMLMRVSIGLHAKKILAGEDTIKTAIETYNMMSTKQFIHATPTLFHCGTPFQQLLSCFLLEIGDSIAEIYKGLADCAQISKWAGGIGFHIHSIRGEGSLIRGTNGRSNGIVPMLKVYNETARYVDQCVLPDTIIYTTKGPMEIQYCEAGVTEIFTTNGPEVIENVLEHPYEGKMLQINSKNSYYNFTITPEHPVYCLRGQIKGLNYQVIRNRLEKNIISPEWIDAKELMPNDMLINTIPEYEKDVPSVTQDDCYMYGLLLGDGCMNNKSTSTYISLNAIDKLNVAEFVRTYLTKKFVPYFEDKNNNTLRIRWNKTIRLPFRYSTLYNTQKDKHVHSLWLNLPLEKMQYIVKGMLHTDGCISNELMFDTTSINLMESMKYMLLRMGIPTGGYIRDRIGEKHVSKYGSLIENKKISYCLRIPKTNEIAKLLNIEPGKFHKFLRHNNMLFSRITSIEEINYQGTLYDLQMKDTHNYMLTSGVVHNGGGKRKGSFAAYLEPWHTDIEKFIEMKKNHGKEEERARDLFYALWISDLFMKRVKKDEDWSLMCPDECPGLSDVYCAEFEELYEKYEKEGRARKVIKARKLYGEICKAQIETGGPYMLYKDAANRKTNQQNIGVIKSSNLCSEILEVSTTDEYACCTLASASLSAPVTEKNFEHVKEVLVYTRERCDYCKLVKMLCKQYGLSFREVDLTNDPEKLQKTKDELKEKYNAEFKTFPQVLVLTNDDDNGEHNHTYTYIGGYSEFEDYTRPWYDFKKLYNTTKVIAKNLNRVIDINRYPVPETERSNLRHRPLGIGTQGLADAFAKMRYPFDSEKATELNRQIFATMYYAAVERSVELAKEEGPYETFKGSPMSQGKFQFDMWEEEARALGRPVMKPELFVGSKDVETTHGLYNNYMELNWDTLRAQVMEHGIRNSLHLASMPTASTSQILGNNEANEAFTSNVYVRRTLAGEFVVINKYFIQDLINLGIWDKRMKDMLIYYKGSPVEIDEIPLVLRELYKTVWDMKQKVIVDQSRDRGIYICQTQSLNIHIAHPTLKELYSLHMYSWRQGLKTGLYYLRTKGGKAAQQVTIDPEFARELEEKEKRKLRERQMSNSSVVEANENKSLIEQIEGFAGNKKEACENCSA
jgi:ribonucleoside-diphosphate reductase alpha subunit